MEGATQVFHFRGQFLCLAGVGFADVLLAHVVRVRFQLGFLVEGLQWDIELFDWQGLVDNFLVGVGGRLFGLDDLIVERGQQIFGALDYLHIMFGLKVAQGVFLADCYNDKHISNIWHQIEDTEFLEQVKQLLAVSLKPGVIIISVDVLLSVGPPFLGDESLVCWKLEPEGVHKLVILFEIGVVPQVKYDLINMIYDILAATFVVYGRAQRSKCPIAGLNRTAIYNTFYNTVIFLRSLHRRLVGFL